MRLYVYTFVSEDKEKENKFWKSVCKTFNEA